MERGELVARTREVLACGPPLRLAVLFGSRATGRARPDSDVDLAIVPLRPDVSLWDEGGIAAELERVLGLTVDVVRLDLAPTLVRWEVVKTGVPVLADPPEAWARTVAQVLAEHADYGPAAESIARSYLRHVAGSTR